ncbi:hypothetical protein [Roseibium algae]|uniref:Uncharacterized protein n=1 Tax=Roseibium algae TaxID=3123038 RepID=A0ABU8TIG0_9HYPH
MTLEVSTPDAGLSSLAKLLSLPDKLWHLVTAARAVRKAYRLDFQQFSNAVLVLAQVQAPYRASSQAQTSAHERAKAQPNQGQSS